MPGNALAAQPDQTVTFLIILDRFRHVNYHLFIILVLGISLCVTVPSANAQQPAVKPPASDEQDPVRVFTEEVRLQVLAKDSYGHFDPTLEPEDVLVLEDGVAQQIRSVQRVPANLLVVLDTGADQSGLGGFSKRTDLTRDVATELLRKVNSDAWIALMQFNTKVELLQSWTKDRQMLSRVLKRKLSSGRGAAFSKAVAAAAEQLRSRPDGTRHVVFITDGVDSSAAEKTERARAIQELMQIRATVHIISYTEFVRQRKKDQKGGLTARQNSPASDPITATDPTLPPGVTRSPSYGVSIRFDPALRRKRIAYENQARESQRLLTEIASETGGQIFLPVSRDEMIAQASDVATEIGAEYVVTYRPHRSLAEANPGEYRRIEVTSRRVGVNLRSRRGYIVSGL